MHNVLGKFNTLTLNSALITSYWYTWLTTVQTYRKCYPLHISRNLSGSKNKQTTLKQHQTFFVKCYIGLENLKKQTKNS